MKLLLLIAMLLGQAPAKPTGQPTPPAAPQVTVTIRGQSEVGVATITVADIAEVAGADAALVARVSAVEVGAAPLVGLSRTLLKADIITRLRFNKIDLSMVSVDAPPTIKVLRVGAELPVGEVVEFAAAALREARQDRTDSVTIEPLTVPARWVIPPGKREMRASAPRGSLEGGMVTVSVAVLVDGRPAKTVDVPFRIRRMTSVLVAARQLEAHTVLRSEDLSVAMVEVSAGSLPLTDPAQAVGLRTTRQVAAGAALVKGSVESAPVVTIGAAVDVQVVVGGISVATNGVARSQGAVGDRVRVFVAKTNREISATVVDAKTVRVEENG